MIFNVGNLLFQHDFRKNYYSQLIFKIEFTIFDFLC